MFTTNNINFFEQNLTSKCFIFVSISVEIFVHYTPEAPSICSADSAPTCFYLAAELTAKMAVRITKGQANKQTRKQENKTRRLQLLQKKNSFMENKPEIP